ncbi:MAG TPA: hypothetical protein VGK99_11490 [Acidobacteriota bacterium]
MLRLPIGCASNARAIRSVVSMRRKLLKLFYYYRSPNIWSCDRIGRRHAISTEA